MGAGASPPCRPGAPPAPPPPFRRLPPFAPRGPSFPPPGPVLPLPRPVPVEPGHASGPGPVPSPLPGLKVIAEHLDMAPVEQLVHREKADHPADGKLPAGAGLDYAGHIVF